MEKTSEAMFELDDGVYSVDFKTKLSYQAFGADLIGYVPATNTNAPQINLIGTLGLAYYDVKLTTSLPDFDSSVSESEEHFGVRAGLGLQYDATDNLSFRVLGRYNYIGMDGLDSIIDVTAGVRYYF
jgi:hypothetical protein